LASALADVVSSRQPPELLDLAELTQTLGAPLGEGSAERWAQPLETLHSAHLLIIATPIYKGSYTGLLKSFLDHVGGGALQGIVAVPVTTVGSPAHTLAADVHLRPLLIELGASTPTGALVAGNDVLDHLDTGIQPWLERHAGLVRLAVAVPPSLARALP
jgi:FMN reductase